MLVPLTKIEKTGEKARRGEEWMLRSALDTYKDVYGRCECICLVGTRIVKCGMQIGSQDLRHRLEFVSINMVVKLQEWLLLRQNRLKKKKA